LEIGIYLLIYVFFNSFSFIKDNHSSSVDNNTPDILSYGSGGLRKVKRDFLSIHKKGAVLGIPPTSSDLLKDNLLSTHASTTSFPSIYENIQSPQLNTFLYSTIRKVDGSDETNYLDSDSISDQNEKSFRSTNRTQLYSSLSSSERKNTPVSNSDLFSTHFFSDEAMSRMVVKAMNPDLDRFSMYYYVKFRIFFLFYYYYSIACEKCNRYYESSVPITCTKGHKVCMECLTDSVHQSNRF
jgi:hypothetical protein